MAKGTDTKIPDLETSWEGYNKSRVEEFVKEQFTNDATLIQALGESKGSYLATLSIDEATSMVKVGIFASATAYTAYVNDPDNNSDLLLSSVDIPMGSGGGSESSYIVKLSNMGEKSITATKKADLVAKIRFTSQLYDPSDKSTSDTNEDAVLTIQTRMQNASEWKTAGTVAIQSQEAADTAAYTEIDLAPYVSDGTQSVRMIATGNTSEKKTAYVNMTVTLTNITITYQTAWQKPFEYRAAVPTITVPMLVTGSITKVLHLKVESEDGSYSKTYEYSLGTSTYTETPYAATIDHPAAHGIYSLEAWITSGDTVKTESTVQNIMCTLSSGTAPLLVLNNIGTFQNWSSVTAFSYAIYNPSADSTDITFVLANLETGERLFAESVQNVQNSVVGTLVFDLEVGTEDNSDFPASMTFMSGDTTLRSALRVVINNSENFAPTSGADFFLNPKTRNNSEASPATIINAVTGEAVKATFEGMSFVSDGWVIDGDTNARCLRVLEGEKVSISYDAYGDDTPAQGLTVEVDFATRNVTDEDGILLKMGTDSTVDSLPVGLWIKAQESCFMSMEKRNEGSQNWIYGKEKRTHVAVNIVPNLYGQGVNYVRVFINGIISREFVYSDNDSFWQAVDGTKKTGGILIAPEGADIDIFGLRIYKKSLSATDVRQNRLSSFATVEEKKAFKEKNDILGESGLVSYGKAYDKYDTILYKGGIPSLKYPDSTVGDVVIHKIGDPSHSGTLYNMTRKGQGSTSKKYWTWNIQSDFKREDAKWVDENGEDHGQCYQNKAGLPMARKLVDKRNWASSMQSHKIGATALYNDLYQEVVGKNEITSIEGNENCRVCVYEDPFLVFQQETDDAEPVFIGMGTFGSGKADKPTFGYDKEKTPDMLMIEGSDNNPRLTKHQVPWIDGDVYYDEEEEGYVYAGTTSWDYDLGNQETIARFQEAFNFVYAYGNRIRPYNGTLTQLKAASASLDISYQYWVTKAETGSARYDLYRYDEIGKDWVPAGVTKNEDGTYATLNVKTQMASYLPSTFTKNEANLDWDKVNDDFITARKQVFAARAEDYFHKKDIMFSMCMAKLLAACDNRAKNTYLWVFDKTSKIRCFQDDLDSILPVDNQGKLTKPYYVEEHDYDDTLGKNYWNGEDNVLYNMTEECFPTELRSTMKDILSAMAKLGGGTVAGCWEKYFFSVCQYFPAVAYNEVARICYEYAYYQMTNGNYNNDTDPITQSLGSQEEGERQWCSDRTFYISSYAQYGEFNPASPSGGNINYRSTEQMTVRFDLTMATWLYPVVTIGQSTILGGRRVKAGESVSVSGVTDSNTQNIVCGVNYMSDIGTWYDKPANETFAFNGSRVKSLVAGTDTVSDIHLKATGLSIGAMTALRHLDIHNISTLIGTLDVSRNARLASVDARGTSLVGISLPQQEFLTTLELPATMQSLRLNGQTGLASLTLEGWTNLQTFYMNQATCPCISALGLIAKMRDCKNLSSVTVYNVDWEDVDTDTLTWLLDKGAKVTGRIAMAEGAKVTLALKMRMVALWGNVDDESNAVYVSYAITPLVAMRLSGGQYLDKEGGKYQLDMITTPTNGNNLVAVEWTLEDNTIADNTIDPATGVVTVNTVGTIDNGDGATVKAVITLSDGTEITAERKVYFYRQELQLGDYLFHDGTVSADDIPSKVIVGVCFIVNPKDHRQGVFLAVDDISVNNTSSFVWGLYSGDSNNGITGITLDDRPNYNVYDTPTPNVGNSSNYNASSDGCFRDEENTENDGWKQYLTSDGEIDETHVLNDVNFTEVTQEFYDVKNFDAYLAEMGLEKGDMISAGQLEMMYIIQHRDKILTDSGVNLPVPEASSAQTEQENLTDCINAIINANATKYQQYYYPAASRCWAYVPNVGTGRTLDARLGLHRWHLMSVGEMLRMSWHLRKGTAIGTEWACFAKALQGGNMVKPRSSWYWSASEIHQTYSWYVYPQSGQLGNDYYGVKYNGYVVRPALAFKLD